jgi:hypothetical protein
MKAGSSKTHQCGAAPLAANTHGGLLPRVLLWGLSIVVLMMAGCTSTPVNHESQVPQVVAPVFPPQEVMQSGDYVVFLEKNQAVLKECQDDVQCAMALFNIGFVYAYPQSPLFHRTRGQKAFEELIEKYPQSPWAHEAIVWTELVKKSIASETKRNVLKGKIKSKETTIKELQKQIDEAREMDMEIDRREKELQKMIERSRQIDMEMDRKERELLQ